MCTRARPNGDTHSHFTKLKKKIKMNVKSTNVSYAIVNLFFCFCLLFYITFCSSLLTSTYLIGITEIFHNTIFFYFSNNCVSIAGSYDIFCDNLNKADNRDHTISFSLKLFSIFQESDIVMKNPFTRFLLNFLNCCLHPSNLRPLDTKFLISWWIFHIYFTLPLPFRISSSQWSTC